MTDSVSVSSGVEQKTAVTPKAVAKNFLALTGGTMTGNLSTQESISFSNPAGGFLQQLLTTSRLILQGGTEWGAGGSLYLYGKDHEDSPGYARLYAHDGTQFSQCTLTPSGKITVDSLPVALVTNYVGEGTGVVAFDFGLQICWGGVTHNTYWTFPAPFATAPRVVATHTMGSSSGDPQGCGVYPEKTRCFFKDGTSNGYGFLIAIGPKA